MSEIVENLSDEELEGQLAQAVLAGPEEPSEPEEVAAEEVAPDVEAEQPEAAAEPAPEEEAQEAEAAEAEEPAPESPEPETEDLEKQELEAQIAEMDARAKHWEQVAGRHGGKLGFLERKLTELESRPAAPAEEPAEYQEAQPPRPAPQQPEKMSTWVINRAIEDGVSQFAQRHPDHAEYSKEMGEYLSKAGYDPQKMLLTDDPAYAQNESFRALEEAYWHVAAEKQANRRQELAAKRADQTAKLKTAKQKAAPSATAAAPPPKPKPKTPDDMDDGQLEAALAKAAKEHWG